MNYKIVLAVILFLAIFLRFFSTNISPPALNWDEASLGYNAYSILKTGKDEWGRFLPLTFEAFGDYKLPGYVYFSAPFITFFGLSEFSIRLLSQISGVISVILIFLITRSLTKKNNLALISAGLLATSPVGIFLSRIALEANLAFCLFLASLFFFLKGVEEKSKILLIFWALFAGVTIFTYNSARVFLPLFLVGLLFIFRKRIKEFKKMFIIPGIIFGLFLITAVYLAILQDSSSRYFWVTILDQGAINYLDRARTNSQLPEVISKLMYNRYAYFTENVLINYFKHFTPEYLFLKGGSHYQFSMPGVGVLYLMEIPFLILGLIRLIKEKKLAGVLLLWLLLAPIPSAITREAPHVLRAIFMLGTLQIIIGMGLIYFWNILKDRPLILRQSLFGVLFLAYFVSLSIFFTRYLSDYPKYYSESWQYGMKQVYEFLNQQNTEDKKIFISKKYGEPHIFYLFFNQYDPAEYQTNSSLVRYERTKWRWVDRLDNIYFINDWEVIDKTKDEKNLILVTSGSNYPKEFRKVHEINFLDGSKAYDVVEN